MGVFICLLFVYVYYNSKCSEQMFLKFFIWVGIDYMNKSLNLWKCPNQF